jgi:hypothetical protein
MYNPGDVVSIHKSAYGTKLGKCYHPWATQAKIIEKSKTHPCFHAVRYLTAGNGRTKAGERSRRLYPWTKLQLVPRAPEQQGMRVMNRQCERAMESVQHNQR